MLKSYKYKIEPNEEQKVLLNKHFGSIRFAYNYFLNERKVDTRIIHKETRDLLPLDDSEKIKEGTEPIWKTEDGWLVVEPKPTPWLIERPLRYYYQYLSISEDGKTNRPWKQDEINKIQELFNSGWEEKREEKDITDEPSIEEQM